MAPRPRHRAAAERPATGDRRLVGVWLRLETEQLQVYPDPGTNWGRKTPRLVDVKPINYEAYFASVAGDPIEGQFSFMVSQCGLFEPAEWLALSHPYSEIKDLLIPLHRPREWQGPLNKAGDNGASLIRFMGPKLGFDEAISLIRKHIIPKLFAANS
jgi:hypothetical protein